MTFKIDHSYDYLNDLARTIVDIILSSPLESKHGIKTTTDRAMGNATEINVKRKAVLRQYYGKTYYGNSHEKTSTIVKRATYAVGCGSVSVGTDPHNYVTRDMTDEMNQLDNFL